MKRIHELVREEEIFLEQEKNNFERLEPAEIDQVSIEDRLGNEILDISQIQV